jgi:hypothetical protein
MWQNIAYKYVQFFDVFYFRIQMDRMLSAEFTFIFRIDGDSY